MAGEEGSVEVVAPVAETPPAAAAVVEAAPAPAEPVVEAAPVEAAAVEEKSAEAAPAEPVVDPVVPDPAKAAEAIEVAPLEPITYEAFNLPEGFEAPAERIEAFTGLLNEYSLSQEAGQKLMDLHAETIKQVGDQMAQHQIDAFAETRSGWVKQFDKQAGNRRDTILNDAKWAIGEVVKDDKARQELWNVLAFTGAGDHPAVINAFASAAKRMRERSAPPQGLPAKAQPTNPAERRYGTPARR